MSKLDNLKLNKYNKMLLNKRWCVEHSRKNFIFLEARFKELHSFNKQFKKIQLRYDHYSKKFIIYIFMSVLSIVIKDT